MALLMRQNFYQYSHTTFADLGVPQSLSVLSLLNYRHHLNFEIDPCARALPWLCLNRYIKDKKEGSVVLRPTFHEFTEVLILTVNSDRQKLEPFLDTKCLDLEHDFLVAPP